MSDFDPSKYLTKLKGKDYLEVKWRLVWARGTCSNLLIDTEHIAITEQQAIFRATATIINEDGIVLNRATGYGSETPRDFGDYIEKAETKAVGRALGALGFGTQFTDDFDEGHEKNGERNVVDSPIARTQAPTRVEAAQHVFDAETVEPEKKSWAQGGATGDRTPGGATIRQRGYALVLCEKAGMSNDERHQMLQEKYKVKSLDDLNSIQMREFIDHVKPLAEGGEQSPETDDIVDFTAAWKQLNAVGITAQNFEERVGKHQRTFQNPQALLTAGLTAPPAKS